MCEYKPSNGDIVEPIRNAEVIRDLVTESNFVETFNKAAKAWSEENSSEDVSEDAMHRIEVQRDCILCGSCYSA